MKRKLPRVIALLAVAAGAAAAWWYDVPARLGWTRADDARLTLYGNVDIRQVQLGFRVGGRIAEMLVDEGDRVKAGQDMARLDAQPYQDALEAAEAQVASQKANLAKLEAGPREAEIAQARALLAERSFDRTNAEQALERARRLRATGAVSEAAFDQAQAARDMAAARVESAQEALHLLEEGSRKEDIAAARASLQEAEANLAGARTSLEDTVLHAPADGVVLSRVREPGAIVSPGDTAYVLSLDDPVWVRTYVEEPDLGRVFPGLDVEVITDTAPDKPYRGRVGFVSPVAEFTPKSVETPELRTDLVYRLRVVVEQPDTGLRQGMPVSVRLPEDAGTATSAVD
ncbi:secretion protein HlyD [Chelativorans sp.]|uniref:secretion protein HlyD n=1 Tax=Chelativorans sp. TaxID=2203393 RepID=UPI002810D099|nr:secretion protein HlyD [Chelativorans sp.]